MPAHWHPTDGDLRHWYRCTVTGLTNGEARTFGVAATNAAGSGPASEITGVPFGAPLAPAVDLVDTGNGTLNVTWGTAAGNGRDVTAYQIVVSGRVVATVGADARSHELSGLANGTEYTVHVRAVNAAGPGASDSVQGVPYTTPDAPPLTVSFIDGRLTVAWSAPFDGGRDITGYRLLIEGIGVSLEVAFGSDGRLHVIDGLAPGNYTVTIAASNEAGEGPWGSAESNLPAVDDEPDPIVPDGSPFADAVGSVFEEDIAWMAASGITKGCNPPTNDQFCPDDIVIRAEVATFLDRYFGLPTTDVDGFTDDDGHELEASLDRSKVADVFRGCNPPTNNIVCPDRVITRGELAAVLVRAFNLQGTGGSDFVDSAEHVFHGEIAVLSANGIAKGCNPPANDRFCPDRELTRGEVAAFLHRVSLLQD